MDVSKAPRPFVPAPLSPPEWLAVLPAFRPVRPVFRGDSPQDSDSIAADVSAYAAAHPLDPRAAVRLAGRASPLFAALSWPAARAPRWFYLFIAWANLAANVMCLVVLAASPGLGAVDQFGARQVAAGVVAYALWVIGTLAFLVTFVRSAFRRRHSDPLARAEYTLGYVARWAALALESRADGGPAGGMDEAEVSPLVTHDPGDELCSCPRESCASSSLHTTALLYIAEICARVGLQLPVFVLWTPFVTLASTFWGTWWSVLLAAMLRGLSCSPLPRPQLTARPAVGTWFVALAANLVNIPGVPNAGVFFLSSRLQARAMLLALSGLVQAAERGNGPLQLEGPATRAYQDLQMHLLEQWKEGLLPVLRGGDRRGVQLRSDPAHRRLDRHQRRARLHPPLDTLQPRRLRRPAALVPGLLRREQRPD
ncbi:hypothetical protein DFJ74DRAFT_692022 [Hyaloraphidium curvatum]|nr:hypothetical protein DFJ74DRAFT_692022 [Hyaloraphidium curvatum]